MASSSSARAAASVDITPPLRLGTSASRVGKRSEPARSSARWNEMTPCQFDTWTHSKYMCL